MSRTRSDKTQNRPSAVDDTDSALFRDTVGPVKHMAASAKRPPERRLPSARPKMRDTDDATGIAELRDGPIPDSDIETGDDLLFRRPGVQRAVIRRLRRGHYRCEAEIDLHGMVVAVARHSLGVFLQQAADRDYRCIRIVHGKGLRSGHHGPVLKTKVAGWLAHRDNVLAYVSARPVDGGTGALYVLLRKS